jgi:predicted XRE-type DNA-binding protein
MKIHTAKYISLSEVATVLGVDRDDLAELADGEFTWGDTDISLVSLPKFLGLLEMHEEETIMESLWDIIGTELAAADYYVNLAD